MKTRILTLLVPAFFFGHAHAQTITDIVPEMTTVYEIDANFALADPGPGGAGMIWDYSFVESSDTYFMSYFPASEGMGNEHFPNATHVEMAEGGIGGDYKYFDFSDGTWRFLGNFAYFGDNESITTYSDPLEYFTLPLTSTSSGTETYANETDFMGQNWTKSATCTWEVDSWGDGTLLLSATTSFGFLLRVKMECEELEYLGSTLLRTNDITHHLWVNNGIGHPVLMHTEVYSVNAVNGNVDDYYLAKALFSVEFNVSTRQIPETEIGIFPNPAADFIQIKTAEDVRVESTRIVDALGRTVREYQSTTELDVSGLNPGMYTVVCTGSFGTGSAPFLKR